MGLKAAIQAAVAGGFEAFGDIRFEATYHENSTSYDTLTGNTTTTTVEHLLKVIREEFTVTELAAGAENALTPKSGDFKLLFPAKGITFSPSTKDQVSIGPKTFTIVANKIDPADAVWILHVRVAV